VIKIAKNSERAIKMEKKKTRTREKSDKRREKRRGGAFAA